MSRRRHVGKMAGKGKVPVCLAFCLAWLISSCGENQERYSPARCLVVVNNQEHNDPTLASAMSSMSPGVFCLIRRTMQGGASHFSFQNNQGAQSTSVFNAKDLRMTLTFGLYNGVIVGFGNLDHPSTFYAYDNQCPNCFDYLAIPRRDYPLTLSPDGTAACRHCHREYNMNTGGNLSKGATGKNNLLTRYRASTTGPLGILRVN